METVTAREVEAEATVAGDTDVLAGRGAFVNSHPGNEYLRNLALARKDAFDKGNYADKRALAAEIVRIIRAQNPPGRFLRRRELPGEYIKTAGGLHLKPRGLEGTWEELSDEKSVHKACQVMRDLKRPDRAPDRTKPKLVGERRGFVDAPHGVAELAHAEPETYAPLTAAALAEHNAAAAAAAAGQQAHHETTPEENVELAAAAAAATVEALDGALNVAAGPAEEISTAKKGGVHVEV
uniref:DUF6824 domain-containing protein n=2 Tax=Odontella aurita TaxID=265563 RepID=A0A7S4JDM3_9STRA|mmetsp:Transcript_44423/g.135402  ORF Transcript_44423/g.135402 Transcript_44423/m.135402 type:complete len:238 (+) Transcript_44423:1346-2059(+)